MCFLLYKEITLYVITKDNYFNYLPIGRKARAHRNKTVAEKVAMVTQLKKQIKLI